MAPGDVPDPGVQAAAPEPPQTTTLGEIIPPEVSPELTEIINMVLRGEIEPPDGMVRITAVLEPHRKYLEERNVVPEYIAAYLMSSVPGMAELAEEGPEERTRRRARRRE